MNLANIENPSPVCLGAVIVPPPALENKFQSELNNPRIVYGSVDYAKAGGSVDVLHAASAARQVKVRVIEQIEKFSPEIKPHSLSYREVLDQRSVRVYKARPRDGCARGIAEFSRTRVGEGTRIEPGDKRMDLGGSSAAGISRHGPRLIGIANHIRPVQTVAVPLKIHAGDPRTARRSRVGAVDHKQGEPGESSLNNVDFPIARNRVDWTAPSVAVTLALTKGQLISHAARKLMVEVKLRQAPIRIVCAGQRPECGSREGAQTIRHSGVVGM